MSVTLGMLRSSAIWQSGSTRITPPEKASRRLFETRSSRKSGTRLNASIEEFRPPLRDGAVLYSGLSGRFPLLAALNCISRNSICERSGFFVSVAVRPRSFSPWSSGIASRKVSLGVLRRQFLASMDMLKAGCPNDLPSIPTARLAAMESRLCRSCLRPYRRCARPSSAFTSRLMTSRRRASMPSRRRDRARPRCTCECSHTRRSRRPNQGCWYREWHIPRRR